MTAPTIQNTVFLVVAEPHRCQVGAKIFQDRANAVKAARDIDEFYTVEGRGWKRIVKHLLKCPACLEYERSRGRMLP